MLRHQGKARDYYVILAVSGCIAVQNVLVLIGAVGEED